MTHLAVARDSLALLCGLQGVATIAIDLNRTHATNPLWPGHARFHLVWQTANVALLALLEVALILLQGPLQELRFYLAAVLAGVPMFGFFAALVSLNTYGGALFDINGIRPARFKIFGRIFSVDLNLATVTGGLLALIAIIAIYIS